MIDTRPFDADDRLRSDLREQDLPGLERRVRVIEDAVHRIDVIVAGRLEGLGANYQHLASVIDRQQHSMDKLVNRLEFQPVQLLVYVATICMVVLAFLVGYSKIWH
jgi:hypothetical protein